jgi:putative type I restriction modification DNA specificity domain protein
MKLGDNVDIIAPLNVKTADSETGYFLLNPTMINNGKIESFDHAEVPDRYKNGKNKIADKYFIKKDDVLFQAKGRKIEVVYIDKDYERVLPSTLYFILRPNEKINPKYLQWLLKTELILLYFEKKYKTMGTVRAVNKVDIVELNVKIPEREIQDEMAKIIISLEEEEENTIKYLEIKRKYIEEKMIENNQVMIDEK